MTKSEPRFNWPRLVRTAEDHALYRVPNNVGAAQQYARLLADAMNTSRMLAERPYTALYFVPMHTFNQLPLPYLLRIDNTPIPARDQVTQDLRLRVGNYGTQAHRLFDMLQLPPSLRKDILETIIPVELYCTQSRKHMPYSMQLLDFAHNFGSAYDGTDFTANTSSARFLESIVAQLTTTSSDRQ